MSLLDYLGVLLGSRVTVTEAVARKVSGRLDPIAIDVARIHGSDIKVFELLPMMDDRDLIDAYNSGFSRFHAGTEP